MLSVKQEGIKYHFLSLWYDSTWNWTQVSRAIGEHSNRFVNVISNTLFRTIERKNREGSLLKLGNFLKNFLKRIKF